MGKIRRRKILYNEIEKVVKQGLEIKNTAIIALADTIRKYSRLMAQIKHNDFSVMQTGSQVCLASGEDSLLGLWIGVILLCSHMVERERDRNTEREAEFSSISSVQSLSHVPLFCDPMDCSTPGLPVHHQLPEFTQAHVH